MRFETLELVRQAIQDYSITNTFDMKFVRNKKYQVVAICMNNDECPWRIYIGFNKIIGEYEIRTLNGKHKCGKIFKNRKIFAKWITREYANRISENPNWKLRSMRSEIVKLQEVHVSKNKQIGAKNIALIQLTHSIERHYAKLWDYK